jgi:hypothetical protein
MGSTLHFSEEGKRLEIFPIGLLVIEAVSRKKIYCPIRSLKVFACNGSITKTG